MSEFSVALDAVATAARLARSVQDEVRTNGPIVKADASPVTIADLAVQATISLLLTRDLGDIDLIAEEDLESLDGADAGPVRAAVLELVQRAVGPDVTESAMLAAIARRPDGVPDEFWTLDPIDGTKGFLRGEQYAIALAKISAARSRSVCSAAPTCPTPTAPSASPSWLPRRGATP